MEIDIIYKPVDGSFIVIFKEFYNATTQNTFPISLFGTTLMIIERITVVVVESRNPIPKVKYNIHVFVSKAIIIFFIMAVNASEKQWFVQSIHSD